MHKLIILDVLRFTLFKERMCNYFSLTKIIFATRIYLTPEFFCIKGRFLSEQIFHEGVTMNILWKFPFFCIEPWKSTFFPTTFALLSWIFMEAQYPQQGEGWGYGRIYFWTDQINSILYIQGTCFKTVFKTSLEHL